MIRYTPLLVLLLLILIGRQCTNLHVEDSESLESVVLLSSASPTSGIRFKLKTNNTCLCLVNLLLLANDIQLNPGPPKYPCGTCGKAVTWKQKAICCDSCDIWFHVQCENVRSQIYECMQNSNTTWECIQCGMPNFSTTLFDLTKLDNNNNPYSVLSDVPDHLNVSNTSSIGSPLLTSSPSRTTTSQEKPKYQHKPKKVSFKPLRILNVNCQSIKNKIPEFHTLVDSVKPDIIFGTESWLSCDIFDAEIFPGNYNIFRRDRAGKQGGGVFIAVNTDIIALREIELETDCELIWVKITIAGCKALHVCCYYRPDVNDEHSLDQFEIALNRLKNQTQNVIIAGDFNFPGWIWNNNETENYIKTNTTNRPLHERFGELLHDFGLTQLVTKPTRGDNILDLILTNNPSIVNKTEILPGISDHDCCFAEFDINPKANRQKPRQIPLYNKADWTSFKQHINQTYKKLKESKIQTNTNSLWEILKKDIQDGISLFIPTKMAKHTDSLPWLNSDIKKLLRKRDKMYKRHKNTPEFKQLKAQIQNKIRQAHMKYLEDIIIPENNNQEQVGVSKRFWTYIKHCKSSNNNISPLKENNILHSESNKKAEILNNQFKSVFSQDSDNLPPPPNPEFPVMADINITVNGIYKLLHNLNPHKAAGPDNISPRVLKELAAEIAPCLQIIFCSSYETGTVPEDWRTANVSPIFKKGEKYKASNYRPVSLTCIVSKLMEHIITSSIMSHANKYDILYKHQHGFRSKLSCETQLVEFITDVTENMSNGTQTDVIVMDFSKAFDKVSHQKLVWKLQRYGICNRTNAWIASFLTGRTQRVLVEGEASSTATVSSGVPQGSVLGPCLFLFYINDMPDNIDSSVRLFADDTIVYAAMKSSSDNKMLQQDLDKLAHWERQWSMEFHPDKCEVIPITRKKKPQYNKYTLNGHTLKITDSAKYLGVNINADLTWNKHIDTITTKANKSLGFLRRNLKVSSPKIKAQAYISLVRPTLEYSSPVWSPYTQQGIDKIEKVQRRAARYVLNRFHNTSSVTGMIESLGWRSLEYRRIDASLCLFYKIVHGLVLIPTNHYMIPPFRSTRLHHDFAYQIPHSNCNYHKFSFFPRTIRVWNALPQSYILASGFNSFKTQIQSLDYSTLCLELTA